MKVACPRVPARLRAQMQPVYESTWYPDERCALLLLQAQKDAAFDACDWIVADALRVARFAVLQRLREAAEHLITESCTMPWAHLDPSAFGARVQALPQAAQAALPEQVAA